MIHHQARWRKRTIERSRGFARHFSTCCGLVSVITQIDGLAYEAFEGQAFGTDGARWTGLPNSRSHRL
jgi:hypothetical protein